MAENDKPPPDYLLRFRPLPDAGCPPIIRLRRLLKTALRAFGLKCVSAVEVPAGTAIVPPMGAPVEEPAP